MPAFKGSRYSHIKLYSPRDGKGDIFVIRDRLTFNTANAKYHTWTQSDTLDFLAYKNYNNAELWWVILDANPQYQTELDIEIGDTLIIPAFTEVVNRL